MLLLEALAGRVGTQYIFIKAEEEGKVGRMPRERKSERIHDDRGDQGDDDDDAISTRLWIGKVFGKYCTLGKEDRRSNGEAVSHERNVINGMF